MLSRRSFGLGTLALAGGLSGGPAMAQNQQQSDQQQPAPQTSAQTPAERFSFDLVLQKAEALAAQRFQPPPDNLPKPFLDLDYDGYRQLRFRPERAIWRAEKLPFQLQMFHRGHIYGRPVLINTVQDGVATPVNFTPDMFGYPNPELAKLATPGMGFAGFRIHTPMNIDTYWDEVAVFLGASYFRAVGKGMVYGISGRGLAIDTALREGEEFPFFREFWIERPAPDAHELNVYALLDSDGLTGGYKFVIRPGEATVLSVEMKIFPRRAIRKLGIAPMTSMYLYGESGNLRTFDDFRPEIHDSDGLLMASGNGEWLWRPLRNPRKLRLSSFAFDSLRGFGLMQRDRDFRSYEDLEALYHQRPSLWIQPKSDWGPGRVEVIEIPSDHEKYDNIGALWVSNTPVEQGKPVGYAYDARFARRTEGLSPNGRATGTRIGAGPDGARRFVVDFTGGRLNELPSSKNLQADFTATRGRIGQIVVQKNQVTGGWRVFFDLQPGKEELIDLRGVLRDGDIVLTETWNYQWTTA